VGNSKFPDDHLIERLRGRSRPSSSGAMKRLASRAAWLIGRIIEREHYDLPSDLDVDELKAIALAIEALDERRLRNIKENPP
jgi:hypothetical protein